MAIPNVSFLKKDYIGFEAEHILIFTSTLESSEIT
jgi:hypothetical protein